MPKLTEREREGFEKILIADLKAINVRFMNQIKEIPEEGIEGQIIRWEP